MGDFFKTFGLGILYVVGLPLILAYWAIYAVYCLLVFIIVSIESVFVFFSGHKFFPEYEEDRLAREILEGKENKEEEKAEEVVSSTTNTTNNTTTTNNYVTNNYYQTTQNAYIDGKQFRVHGLDAPNVEQLDTHYDAIDQADPLQIPNQSEPIDVPQIENKDDDLIRPSFLDEEIKKDQAANLIDKEEDK